MKHILMTTAVALAGCMTAAVVTLAVPTPQEQTAPVANTTAASSGLSDLESMTFGCPMAALNAAARRAARAPSQGTYQFSYFKIINDAHHAMFEVHFKSNYEGEGDLKYCVAMYCQQGWDPATAKTEVTLMSNAPQRAGAAHGLACSQMPMPRRTPR